MDIKRHNILRTEEQLAEVDKYLMGDDDTPQFPTIAVDTETNGVLHFRNVVIGISFSVNNNQGFYVPILSWVPKPESLKKRKVDKVAYESYMEGYFQCVWTGETYSEDVTPEESQTPEIVKHCINRWFNHDDVALVMHNAQFDALMIEASSGIDLAPRVWLDTMLLKHVLDENSPKGLKETAMLWTEHLPLDVEKAANQEQKELLTSIIINGGKKKGQVWRGAPEIVGKYACQDTILTFAVMEHELVVFKRDYTERHREWFFEKEVMPLCREIVIPMKRRGVRINVPYFEKIEAETRLKMEQLEADIIKTIGPDILDFDMGSSVYDEVSRAAFIKRLIKMEGLKHPTKLTKGVETESLAKPVIEREFQKNPHWLWGYILGEDEIKYPDDKIEEIIRDIYKEKIGRRYHFNIGSDFHLRWLLCGKYGTDPKSLPQTDSATLENPIASMKAEVLKEYFLDKHNWVAKLLLYKKHKKLHSTYILPALNLNNKGILHMNWNQAGTISGRFSCSGGFNLQTLPAVEELDNCPVCGSTNLEINYEIELLADVNCPDCDYVKKDIICPSAIKKGFIAPNDYVILNADYSSLEPRCFAYMSGDQGLKDVYQKGLDLYSKVYIDTEEPDGPYSAHPDDDNFLKKAAPKKRKMVKPGVLGVPYGSGDWQLAKIMNFKKKITDRETGEEVEIVDAKRGAEWIDKYLGAYPELRNYMLKQDTDAVTQGYVETIIGRRRHFKYTVPVNALLIELGWSIEDFMNMKRKDLAKAYVKDNVWLIKDNLVELSKICGFNMKDKKGQWRNWDFVRAMFKNELNNSKNVPIQGLGAHITNLGMLDMQRAFYASGLRAHVVLQVHDEVGVYAHRDDAEAALPIMKACMEDNDYAKMIDVPMIADPLIAETLKEAK